MRRFPLLMMGLMLSMSAAANDCDPEVILSKDRSIASMRNEVAMAYAELRTEAVAKSDTQSAELTFPIKGLPVKVGASTASAFSSFLQEQLNYTYTAAEHRYFLSEHLSANSVAAYEACLNRPGVRIAVDRGAYRSSDLHVTVRWIADGLAHDDATVRVTATNATVLVEADGAWLPAVGPRAVQGIVKGGAAVFKLTRRNTALASEISAMVTVPGTSKREVGQIVLPAVVDYEVVLTPQQQAFTPHLEQVRYVEAREQQCIEVASSNAMLIPETASIGGRFTGGNGAGYSIETKANSPAKVCGAIFARKSDPPHDAWIVDAKLSVTSVSVQRRQRK